MKKAFLPIKKVIVLHEIMSFLDTYMPIEGEVHHIGSDLDSVDVENTKLLNELGELNKRRKEVIELLMKNS